jgi:uncharacterized damage-inducible protein DinB
MPSDPPTDPPTDPPMDPDHAERTALLAHLNAQRRHIVGILDGLDDDALRRPMLPSGWSCLGLVQHLALDVERFWFRAVAAGEQVALEDGDGGWRAPPDRPSSEVFELYRDEISRADEIVRARRLDAAPAWWPEEIFPGLPAEPLRETVLHVITETATHAGHLDAVRELIDGRRWMVLT